ncbi:MAG: PAS domain S-box protein [Ktedonobacteraceae bacterium]|nr:PAS domain S-box protein [Ktedonobacteraceae bacterium]
MSWSHVERLENLHDQLTILLGGAIRLLCGEAGVFVVSKEAFDPQSSAEYTLYQIDEERLERFLAWAQRGRQPNSVEPLVCRSMPHDLVTQPGLMEGETEQQEIELCSLFLHDPTGPLGMLYYVRLAGMRSCFECGTDGTVHMFVAQLAVGLRFALKAQSLEKEQARLAAIFQYSAEGILTVDAALRIIDFNPAMERLTGWPESEVLGCSYFKVLRPKDRYGNDLRQEDSPILQAFAGQVVLNKEMVISTRDGQCIDVCVTASCVRSVKGEPMNGILNVRDITLQRQQEEQRSMFISVISHELQTPIAIIKGYASTLARPDAKLDAKALRKRLLAIEEEADRLNKLVGNLLYASRIQAGGLSMEVAPLDLVPLIRGVTRRLIAKSPDVAVELDIPANLPLVMADRDRIEEVLQNLLDNAVKYSPHQRALTITCRATGEEVIVSVSDKGMGISLRDQERIFDRFQRVGGAPTQAMPGAGLGLYICRVIVEAHGGHIWVESTLHQGSTFSFSLPREEKAQLPMVMF